MNDFLTVGIPIWNDPKSIEKSIGAIIRSTAWINRGPSEKELIVCVNGVESPNDVTLATVNRLSRSIPQLKVLSINARGQNFAINLIAKAANPKSSSIFFCDSDVLVKRNTISRVTAALKSRQGIKFAGAAAIPATVLIPKKYRSSFKAYLLKRHNERMAKGTDFISGAGWAVDKEFFLKNPLPETSKIANDVFINATFKGKIALVRDAKLFYLLPSAKDRLFQKSRYLIQEHSQGINQNKRISLLSKGYTLKERRGLLISITIDKLAKLMAKVNPKLDWRTLSSTKLKDRRK